MRQNHGRQFGRRQSLRDDEIGGNLLTVTGGIPYCLHTRQVLARKLGAQVVQLLDRTCIQVIQERRAGIDVSIDVDDALSAVLRGPRDADRAVGKVGAQKLEVALELWRFRINPHAIAGVVRRNELLGVVVEDGTAEIHLTLGIALHQLDAARRDIHKQQA